MSDNIVQPRAAKVREALELLRWARDLLKDAGAEKALERTRLAITSTEGAVRHAERKDMRAEMPAGGTEAECAL